MFLRGIITGFSEDVNNNNICVLQYDSIYFAVLSVEELYFEWIREETESYAVFKKICQIYEYLETIQEGCHYKELFKALKLKIPDGTYYAEEFLTNFTSDVLLLVKFFFILWYGIIWLSPEDIGESVGFYIARAYGERLETYNPNPTNWVSPMNNLSDDEIEYILSL